MRVYRFYGFCVLFVCPPFLIWSFVTWYQCKQSHIIDQAILVYFSENIGLWYGLCIATEHSTNTVTRANSELNISLCISLHWNISCPWSEFHFVKHLWIIDALWTVGHSNTRYQSFYTKTVCTNGSFSKQYNSSINYGCWKNSIVSALLCYIQSKIDTYDHEYLIKSVCHVPWRSCTGWQLTRGLSISSCYISIKHCITWAPGYPCESVVRLRHGGFYGQQNRTY